MATSSSTTANADGSFAAAQQQQTQPAVLQLRSVEEGLRLMSVDDGRRRNAKRFRPWVVGMVGEEMAAAAADVQQHWSQFGFMDEGNPREVVARLTDLVVGRVRFLRSHHHHPHSSNKGHGQQQQQRPCPPAPAAAQ